MGAMKFCSKCGQVKDSQDFCRDSSKKNGLSSWCIICVKVWSRGLHVEYNLEVVPAGYNVAKGNNYWPHGYGEHSIENLQYNRAS